MSVSEDHDEADQYSAESESTPSHTPSSPPTKQRRLVSEIDIGVFVSERSDSCGSVSDDDKYNLIVNNTTPSTTDILPARSHNRRFQCSWLIRFKWLRYSKHDNGGYCLPCVLFAKTPSQCADPGMLVKTPLTNFRKAIELLR